MEGMQVTAWVGEDSEYAGSSSSSSSSSTIAYLLSHAHPHT